MKQHTIVKTAPIALLVAFFATRYVRGRYGDETFICDTGAQCDLGSGLTWLLTGITSIGPFIALAGFMWSRRLHHKERLGPFSSRAIPDGEQILEVLMVIGAIGASYWLMLNGPAIEPVTIGRPNTWAEWLREFRAPDQLTAADQAKLDEVPSRRTWFLIGTLLGAPLMLSLGTMLGREWYGRKRRKAQREAGEHDDHIDLTAFENTSGRATIDLTDIDQVAGDRSLEN